MSVERIKGWLQRNPQGGPEPIHPDDLRALLAARAEAQDEGAAGEDVVQWFKPSERTPESGKKFVALHEDGSGAWLGFMHDGGIIDADGDDFSQTLKGVAAWAYLPTGFEFCCEGYPEDPVTLPGHVCPPLYAHPSPTPAADADRVRIAVEALERIAEEAPFRSGYSQSDVEYGPTLSIDEMQSVARAALSHMKPE